MALRAPRRKSFSDLSEEEKAVISFSDLAEKQKEELVKKAIFSIATNSLTTDSKRKIQVNI